MNQKRERIQNSILFVIDLGSLLISYYLSGYIWLMRIKGLAIDITIGSLNDNLITILATFTLAFLFYSNNENFVSRGIYREATSVLKTNLVIAAIIAINQLLDKSGGVIPRGVFVITIALNTFIMFGIRQFVKRQMVHFKYTSGGVSRMLLITTSERVEQVLNTYDRRANWLHRIIGIVLVDQNMKGQSIKGFPVVTDQQGMMQYIKNTIVDEVYISLDNEDGNMLVPLVMELEDMGITVHLKLKIMDGFKDFDITYGKIGTVPVVTFANQSFDIRQIAIKKVMDVVGALVGIIIMLVAMVFVAPAIKLESKGPIFFKQRRVGKNGRYFNIYKFRSMYIDAEERKKGLSAQNEMNGLMFKIKDDPRITKVGKFLRKTSIDELPQFINVLQGDMSLVGTRPPTESEFHQYEGHHKRRLSMKPGITGLWQAYGRNTVTDFEEIVEMDLEYIDNWNIGLDIKILLKTIVTVLKVSGQ